MFKFNLRGKVHRDAERQLTLIIDKLEDLKKQVDPLLARASSAIETPALVGPYAVSVIGDSSSNDPILASIGTGNGSVTEVDTGTGLTGGPITVSGTIALDITAVIAESYVHPSFTVNAQGQLTAAATGYTAFTCTFDATGVIATLEDTLGGPTFSNIGTGDYNLTLTGAFPIDHIWLSALLPTAIPGRQCFIVANRIDDDNIKVKIYDDTITPVDPNAPCFLEIRVYP